MAQGPASPAPPGTPSPQTANCPIAGGEGELLQADVLEKTQGNGYILQPPPPAHCVPDVVSQ